MRSRTIARGLALAGTAALALSLSVSGATAGPGKAYGKLAAKQCAKERKALGKATFGETHGKPAMPNCIGVVRNAATAEARSAAKECRADGVNPGNGNAFGKCVTGKVNAELTEDRQDRVNAAKECRAERDDSSFAATHGGMTFEEFYGSNENRRNAFGKCVSGKAKAKPKPTKPTTPEPTS